MLTADTVTDEQIRALLAEVVEDATTPERYRSFINATHALYGPHPNIRAHGRAECARILNERAKEPK